MPYQTNINIEDITPGDHYVHLPDGQTFTSKYIGNVVAVRNRFAPSALIQYVPLAEIEVVIEADTSAMSAIIDGYDAVNDEQDAQMAYEHLEDPALQEEERTLSADRRIYIEQYPVPVLRKASTKLGFKGSSKMVREDLITILMSDINTTDEVYAAIARSL